MTLRDLNNLRRFYLDAISMLNNSHKMPNNKRSIAKMRLKFDSAYNNCLWIFNSTQKRINISIYNFHANFVSRIKSPKKTH